jgi:hypothetical protein
LGRLGVDPITFEVLQLDNHTTNPPGNAGGFYLCCEPARASLTLDPAAHHGWNASVAYIVSGRERRRASGVAVNLNDR